jgi:pimeloyl-[acyl-carrier protein] methyl ester esterase
MKPKLVLLHGWGVNSQVWNAVLPELNKTFEVLPVDLPGYGSLVDHQSPSNLDQLADSVLDRSPESSIWCGWSLGGMVAMAAAIKSPERINSLTVVCSTPKFMQNNQWPHGSTETAMSNLSTQFEKDYRKALARFFLLQLGTAPDARSRSRELASEVFDSPEASWSTLESGLKLLHETDFRSTLAQIQTKTHVIVGTEDRVIPADAGRFLASQILQATLHEINAGHVPFLTHPQWFTQTLKQVAGAKL